LTLGADYRRAGCSARADADATTRDDWLSDFEDEIVKLRPHLSGKMARTLALH